MLSPGSYEIQIYAYSDGGDYQLDIDCMHTLFGNQTHYPTPSPTAAVYPIKCDETHTGNRKEYEEIAFTFTSTGAYREVYLEACNSTHALMVRLEDASGAIIAEDSDNLHGMQKHCGHMRAGDMTIPGFVSIGDHYTFTITRYEGSRSPRAGEYTVTLFCLFPITPDPTKSPLMNNQTYAPSPNPTYPPSNAGCSNTEPEFQKEVISQRIYACSGTIEYGGFYGTDAQALCSDDYHVCDSAIEAKSLGLTAAICNSITNETKFFGTKESSKDWDKCASDYPSNSGLNEAWGCGGVVLRYYTCYDTLTAHIQQSDLTTAFQWKSKGSEWTEAISLSLTDASGGGVLCCIGASQYNPYPNVYQCVVDGLISSHYQGTAYSDQEPDESVEWEDISPNEAFDADVNEGIGIISNAYDTLAGYRVVSGDITSTVQFGPELSEQHTVISLCKYNDAHKNTILHTTDGGIFGFYKGRAGVAFENGWIKDEFNHITDGWLLSTQSPNLYRGNGLSYTGNDGIGSTGYLAINNGTNSSSYSDWSCAEVIIIAYKILELNEIQCIENSLNIKYNLSLPNIGTSFPTLAPTAPSKSPTMPTNVPTLNPNLPTEFPSSNPTIPTNIPSLNPTIPTDIPSMSPTPAPIECRYGTFKFDDLTDTCFACAQNEGFECLGKSVINVQSGYWIAAKLDNSWVSLIDEKLTFVDNYTIISFRCPSGQCCNDPNGCDYYEGIDMTSSSASHLLCAEGRNVSSITCSSCNDNLSELLNSNGCGVCKNSNYYYMMALFVLSLIFSVFMIFISSRPPNLLNEMKSKQEMNWYRLLIKDEEDITKTLIAKVTLYYYQSMNQILSTKNIIPLTQFENILLTVANFEISGSLGSSGICFIASIQSGLHELLISYLFYIFLMFNAMIVVILSYFTDLSLCSLKPFIKTGIISVVLMSAGPILSTSFKLLACLSINDIGYFHFYDSRKQCFGFIWIFGLILICIICAVFIMFWFLLFNQNVTERENESNEYRSLVNKYRSNVWFWEFVLYLRRFGIALLTSFNYIAVSITNISLLSFIVILFGLQIKLNPFRYTRANVMEVICLFGLVSIIICLNFFDDGDVYRIYILFYLTFLILMPFAVVMVMIILVMYRWCYFRKNKDKSIDFNKQQKQLERIKERMPLSYKQWFEEVLENKGNNAMQITEGTKTDKSNNHDTDDEHIVTMNQTVKSIEIQTKSCNDSESIGTPTI